VEIQHYLRSGKTLQSLEQNFAIKHNRHQKFPNLVLLKYNQIESDFSIPMVRECRGVILDEDNNWKVISRGFDKFFNASEQLAAEIDWFTARVQEKLDGSLCCLFHYKNEWLVATSGMADASGQVNGFNFTFAELFWKVFKEKGYSTENCSPYWTYLFELMTPYNRVVVQHSNSSLKLITCKGKEGDEWNFSEDFPFFSNLNGFEIVKSFPLTNLQEIINSFENINPLEQEGYVVVDGNFNRIKVKHPGYIALHHAKDSFGPKEFVRIIRMGETEEFRIFLKEFPEWEEYFNEIKGRFLDRIKSVCAGGIFTTVYMGSSKYYRH